MKLMVVNPAVSRILAVAAVVVLLAACATSPKKDLALEQVKAQLQELQADERIWGVMLRWRWAMQKGRCVRLRLQAVTKPTAST